MSSDQQQRGLETDLEIDRATAARLGVTPAAIDNTLYDAFGQRQVSTIFNPLNQYHVVMELAPRYWQDPRTLGDIWVSTSGGANPSGTGRSNAAAGTVTASGSASQADASLARNQATNAIASIGKSTASTGAADSTAVETMVPLAAFSRFGPGHTPLSVNHQGMFVATTITFNLQPGVALSDGTAAIRDTMRRIGLPASIHGDFQGAAATFQQSLGSEPILIAAALAAIYIVLGVLYESYVHPLTILSTLPSAGLGAVLALLLFHIDFSIIALIGVILLIGIVKKNAIMMIDVALEAERREGMSSAEAIRHACLLRFRPIMMTTLAAMLGALPLAIGSGEGSELRQPLGIAIVGGLLVSQALTLYTTPIVYLYLDRFRLWLNRRPMAAAPEPGR